MIPSMRQAFPKLPKHGASFLHWLHTLDSVSAGQTDRVAESRRLRELWFEEISSTKGEALIDESEVLRGKLQAKSTLRIELLTL